MIFTPKQLNTLINAIENLHWSFIAEQMGTKYVPDSVLKQLADFGIKKTLVVSKPEQAFQFGLLSIVLKDSRTKKMNFKQFLKFIKSGKWLPMTKGEIYGLSLIENRLIDGIKGLGNKVSSDFKTIFIEKDLKQRAMYEKIIRGEAKSVFANRQGVKSLVSELGHKTNDWARDFSRISQFVLHESFDNGRAFGFIRKYGEPEKVRVYKRVHKGSCKICDKLFNEFSRKHGGYRPKEFYLSELLANGTNVGKKQSDWLPVVGSVHPWCRCDLEIILQGYEWDWSKKRYVLKTLTQEEKDLSDKYNIRKFLKVEKIKE